MKNKVHYSDLALRDMDDIWDYIVSELQNPIAAAQVVDKIMDDVEQLERFPQLGTPVPSADLDREFRYLTSGSYMIFYHVRSTEVYIDRVLYGRRDYLRVLFEDRLQGDDLDG